jgi:hypothetical protein
LAVRIWIDVEDIFISATTGGTPTEIQRLSFELSRALHDNYGEAGDIRLVQDSPTLADFVEAPWGRRRRLHWFRFEKRHQAEMG